MSAVLQPQQRCARCFESHSLFFFAPGDHCCRPCRAALAADDEWRATIAASLNKQHADRARAALNRAVRRYKNTKGKP